MMQQAVVAGECSPESFYVEASNTLLCVLHLELTAELCPQDLLACMCTPAIMCTVYTHTLAVGCMIRL